MSCARITDSDTHLTTMSRRMQLGEQFRCQNFGHSCPSSLGPEANGEASKKVRTTAPVERKCAWHASSNAHLPFANQDRRSHHTTEGSMALYLITGHKKTASCALPPPPRITHAMQLSSRLLAVSKDAGWDNCLITGHC
jgi:hypothetical protein